MSRRIVFDSLNVGVFIAARAKCIFNPATDHTIGVVDDSKQFHESGYVLGGVLFTNYTQASIWLHMAGSDSNWATPTFLWVVFDYAFNQLGCRRIYGIVEKENELALKINMKLGFEIAACLPDVFASGDGIVVYMTPAQCKWLNVKPRTLMEGSDGRRQRRERTGT